VSLTGDGVDDLIPPADQVHNSHGHDAFQTLEIGLQRITRLLDASGVAWNLFPEEHLAPGYDGAIYDCFNHFIAPSAPATFQRKMRELINVEAKAAMDSSELGRHYRLSSGSKVQKS